MARPIVDIKMLGDKQLERMLASFATNVQKTVVRGAIRKTAKHIQFALVQAFSGQRVGVDTGRTVAAIAQQKAASLTKFGGRKSGVIGYGIPYPTREQLGISPKDKHYYPNAIEYGYTMKNGTHVPAKMPIRGTVNRMEASEKAQIIAEMKKGIERRWRREMRKKRRRVA